MADFVRVAYSYNLPFLISLNNNLPFCVELAQCRKSLRAVKVLLGPF